jgi:hypothetical protein
MDSRLIHIHNKVIRVCVFGLFLCSSLCLWAQDASSTPSLEELISRIAEAEKKLVNMKIEGEASEEQRVLPTDSWKPNGVSVSSTAWFNGLPNSKARVDVHQETLQKKEGGFLQTSYSVSFDGQTGRIVRRLTGTPGAMSEVKRAEILPSAPGNLLDGWRQITSGDAFCLNFVAQEEEVTFSELLKAMIALGKKLDIGHEKYQGVDCFRIYIPISGSYYGQTYWLDAEHGLAFRGFENATERDGHRFVVERKVVTEITEAAPGVWCPREAYYQYCCPDPNQPHENRTLFRTSKVVANDPFFDEEVFHPAIPSGYVVRDKILGTVYRVGLDERVLERQLNELSESVLNSDSVSPNDRHDDDDQVSDVIHSTEQEAQEGSSVAQKIVAANVNRSNRVWVYRLAVPVVLGVSLLGIILLIKKRNARG